MEEVNKWLSSINKREYANSLEANGWDNMDAIKMMNIQDLKDCISKPGHVMQLFAEIQKLKDITKQHESIKDPEMTQTQRCKMFLILLKYNSIIEKIIYSKYRLFDQISCT